VSAQALGRLESAPLAEAGWLAKSERGSIGGLTCCPVAKHHMPRTMDKTEFFSPQAGKLVTAPPVARALFSIGDIVRHRLFGFRGVVFDIDPVFANSEEWYQAIPAAVRPTRDQPFYHLFAENGDATYVAYVSQQNLLDDSEAGPINHPSVAEVFESFHEGHYQLRRQLRH
jgi:heat shock protein HspQ